MCTATLLPLPTADDATAFRLVTNRDEQHARAPAISPEVRRYGRRAVLMPVDPSSDGTWVAANDAGLAITLLNLNLGDAQPDPVGRSSRGAVVPSLMHHAAAADAAAEAERIDAAAMMPFRLLVADGRAAFVVRSDGTVLTISAINPAGRPTMLTSSGLGDHLVATPRRELFHASDFKTPDDQDAFHRHRWPDRPHLSVAMHREDARTVSRTVVEVSADVVTMAYTPIAFDGTNGETASATLPRRAEASA
ncbi:MAG: NRDE family protein [Planctomycetota bacterium]